jgi:anion-transporting  ArsA/GET3 family ATPase
VAVVTIDPAKRLADALGLDSLSNQPSRVDGVGPGELWALMLDTKATFDEVVRRHAPSAEQADEIVANRFYRNISTSLSGTQEYMATEKLYALHEEFDLVVVDTPPSRHALDFLDAPRRLTSFLDHRIYRALTGRSVLRPVNLAARTVIRSVARVVGAAVVDDAVQFFNAFDGMEAGFRARAAAVAALLVDPATAFVLVTTPRADTLAEAEQFATRLADAGHGIDAIVLNRVHPAFGRETAQHWRAVAACETDADQRALLENLVELTEQREAELAGLARLTALAGSAPVVEVPLRATDVHDLAGLIDLGGDLLAQ